jgi:hypothetical protein
MICLHYPPGAILLASTYPPGIVVYGSRPCVYGRAHFTGSGKTRSGEKGADAGKDNVALMFGRGRTALMVFNFATVWAVELDKERMHAS